MSKSLLSFTLYLSAGLAVACSPQVKPDGPDKSGCTGFCERHVECAEPKHHDDVNSCIQECEGSKEWSGPCASEVQQYLECATREENDCPIFSEIGKLNEDTPCYEENDLYSLFVNENTPAG